MQTIIKKIKNSLKRLYNFNQIKDTYVLSANKNKKCLFSNKRARQSRNLSIFKINLTQTNTFFTKCPSNKYLWYLLKRKNINTSIINTILKQK